MTCHVKQKNEKCKGCEKEKKRGEGDSSNKKSIQEIFMSWFSFLMFQSYKNVECNSSSLLADDTLIYFIVVINDDVSYEIICSVVKYY